MVAKLVKGRSHVRFCVRFLWTGIWLTGQSPRGDDCAQRGIAFCKKSLHTKAHLSAGCWSGTNKRVSSALAHCGVVGPRSLHVCESPTASLWGSRSLYGSTPAPELEQSTKQTPCRTLGSPPRRVTRHRHWRRPPARRYHTASATAMEEESVLSAQVKPWPRRGSRTRPGAGRTPSVEFACSAM